MANDIISSWNTISTNSGDIILNDTTRDDLIDILNEIKRISKVSKFTTILDIFDEHTKGYGVADPHHTKLAELTGSILEKFYNIWLTRGHSESLDAFKDLIYQYYKYGGSLDIFNDIRDDKIISVKSFVDFFQKYHDHKIGVYGVDAGIFDVSQSTLRWPGEIHGLKIVSTDAVNNILALVSEDNTLSEDIWYTCDVEISMKFVYAKISAAVVSNKEMIVKYKNITDTEWTILGDAIGIDVYKIPQADGSIIDLLDYKTYKYELPAPINKMLQSVVDASELDHRTVQFMFTPKYPTTDTVSITDFIVSVDGSATLTDDPDKKELYSNYPHNTIWNTFLTELDDVEYKQLYYTRNFNYSVNNKTFNMNGEMGSILVKFQPCFSNNAVLMQGETTEQKTITVPVFSFIDPSNKTLCNMSCVITGMYVVGSTNAAGANRFTDISDIHLVMTTESGVAIPICNMTKSFRAIYNIGMTYRKYSGITFYYFDETGNHSVTVTDDLFATSSVVATVNLIYSLTTGGFMNINGVKELIVYDTVISEKMLDMYTLDNNVGYPYINNNVS